MIIEQNELRNSYPIRKLPIYSFSIYLKLSACKIKLFLP